MHIRSVKSKYEGDFSRIRVRWLPGGSVPTLEPYLAQLRQEYGSIDLELYAEEGEGFCLPCDDTYLSAGYKVDRRLYSRTPPPIRSDDDVCFDMIKHWIDECIREHGCGLVMT